MRNVTTTMRNGKHGVQGCKRRRWLVVLFLFLLVGLIACSESEEDETVDGDSDQDEPLEDGDDTPSDGDASLCDEVICPDHAQCDEESGECVCDEGYEPLGDHCVALAADGDDSDDDDDDIDGDEDGDTDDDDDDDSDGDDTDGDDLDGDGEVTNYCEMPQAPTLRVIHYHALLQFSVEQEGQLEVGISSNPNALEPDSWQESDSISLDTLGQQKVFARLIAEECEPAVFSFVYEVREGYPPGAGQDGSSAISKDDSSILGWATAVESVSYGENVDEGWRTPDKALGQAVGTSTDIVCLGRGGEISLSFDPPIRNGEGYDFAVFENGFSDDFLELAYVEVSSDGEHFLRFDHAYLGDTALGGFDSHDTALIGALGGKYRQGFGNPFDLGVFVNKPLVRDGSVDLSAIRYVRIVDLIGDGSATDSFGHVIYDPYPTTGSAGFDLDAIGVLNH